MGWKEIVIDMGGDLGEDGLDILIRELEKLEADADSAWKKVTLDLVGDLLKKHGIDGLAMAKEILKSLGENKVPDLSDLSLGTASNVLAELQNAEAKQREQYGKYINTVADVLATLIKGLVSSL